MGCPSAVRTVPLRDAVRRTALMLGAESAAVALWKLNERFLTATPPESARRLLAIQLTDDIPNVVQSRSLGIVAVWNLNVRILAATEQKNFGIDS